MSNLSQAGNQYRRIKSQCLPLFDLAAGRSEDLQESPGGRVQPPQFIDPNRPPFARYDYAIPA